MEDHAKRPAIRGSAPYAFVPFPDFCIPTPWAPSVPSHAKPHPDGISGEFVVRWTAETRVLVGGTDNGTFYRDASGNNVLPGSSIRGCIRSLLEALTMARMNHVHDEAWFSTRDFSRGSYWHTVLGADGRAVLPNKPPYVPEIGAGWLRRTGQDSWIIKPVSWKPVTHSEIGNVVSVEGFNDLTVKGKYQAFLSGDPHKAFDPNDSKWRYVFSGPCDNPENPKNKEAAFGINSDRSPIQVSRDDLLRFHYIHSQAARGEGETRASALAFWESVCGELVDGTFGTDASNWTQGIPVFYIEDKKPGNDRLPKGVLISLARSFKVPFRHSVGDVRRHRQGYAKSHAEGALDFVEALFGHVPQEGAEAKPDAAFPREAAWRGRVQFGDAHCVQPSSGANERSKTVTGVTGSPRPSFSPYYVRQVEGTTQLADWSTAGANLAGFKRYPVRGKDDLDRLPRSGGAVDGSRLAGEPGAPVSRTESIMTFLPAGVQFEGRVRFHNLLPGEIGALLFALFWEAPDSALRHAMGRGKPFGCGQMKASLEAVNWAERNMGNGIGQDWSFNHACRDELVACFKDYLLTTYNRLVGPEAALSFEAIPAVADILAMQDPRIGAQRSDDLRYPEVTGGPEPAQGRNIPAYSSIRSQRRTLPGYRRR